MRIRDWSSDVCSSDLALLKAFLEQVMRPGFAIDEGSAGAEAKLLSGRSARIIVTMGMPAPFYRFFYRAHSLKSLDRNILRAVGFDSARYSIIGSVEASAPARAARSEERRVGKACVSTCRSRCSPYH